MIKKFEEFVNERYLYSEDTLPNEIKNFYEQFISEFDRQNTKNTHKLDLSMIDVSDIQDPEYLFSMGTSYGDVVDTHKFSKYFNSVYELDITGWNTSNWSNFYRVFNGLYNVRTIIGIEDLDVSNGKSFAGTFEDCSNLENLDLSKWNVSNAENINGMFRGCENLRSVNVTNWDISNVESCFGLFKDCKQLKQVIGWDKLDFSNMESRSDIDDMVQSVFKGCDYDNITW